MSEIAIPLTHLANKTHRWSPGDTEENWKKTREKFGPTWKYYDDPIEYRFNGLGYRSQGNVTDPFFIALGCSYTMGVGIHEEDRYGDVLSKELNMPYMNFGIGGGSQNFVWMNNILLAKNLPQKPKFVIIQWPEIARLNILGKDGIRMFLPNFHGGEYANRSERNLYLGMIDSPEFLYPQALTYYESVNLLWKSLGVKVVNLTLSIECEELFDIFCLKGWSMDEKQAARDRVHPGPKHNIELAEYIKSQL
jgi:hypothetical protein